MTIQKITADLSQLESPSPYLKEAQRVETGALQINDDWPGVFIRGDNAMMYSMYLHMAVERLNEQMKTDDTMDVFMVHGFKGLMELMSGCRV